MLSRSREVFSGFYNLYVFKSLNFCHRLHGYNEFFSPQVFAICAFATTTNFGSSFSFIVKCKNETMGTQKITQSIEYPFRYNHIRNWIVTILNFEICFPFRFDHIIVEEKACGNNYVFSYFGDYSSDAEFFVAAGVLAMLYSLASLVFYCLCGSSYQNNKTIPLVVCTCYILMKFFKFNYCFVWQDFLVTMVIAVFWLSGSAAWASGVSAVKYVSDPSGWIKNLKICMENAECSSLYAGNFAGLNISIVLKTTKRKTYWN